MLNEQLAHVYSTWTQDKLSSLILRDNDNVIFVETTSNQVLIRHLITIRSRICVSSMFYPFTVHLHNIY